MEDVHTELLTWDLQLNILSAQQQQQGGVSGRVSHPQLALNSSTGQAVSVPLKFPQGLQQYVDTFRWVAGCE